MRIPDAGVDRVMASKAYPAIAAPLPLDSSKTAVALIANNLSDGADPGSIDSQDLQGWLLHHKKASQTLREELAVWVE